MFGSIRDLSIATFIVVSTALLTANSCDRTDSVGTEPGETRTWPRKTIDIVRSLYLDSGGMPSHEVFLRTHGLYPLNQEIGLTPYFRASYTKDNVEEIKGRLMPRASAEPLSLDFYAEHTRKHEAPDSADPIWDGRVYEENGKLIVGGYSERVCEQPVGEIGEDGQFVPKSEGISTDQFLLLRIPPGQIVFDPFEWKLSRVTSSEGKTIMDRKRTFLPIKLYGRDGMPMDNLRFALRKASDKASLVLECFSENGEIELAKCKLLNSNIVDRSEGYRPELIPGCSQPAIGDVITFTLKGEFSKQVRNSDDILQVVKWSNSSEQIQQRDIVIDGHFDDWRNVQGVSDPEGDHVDYLYPNPDTDILEFKVANDDRRLYLYSRVAGAHGRTGPNGRYYWYTYIDVDANPDTGYPPTRDDNCYFGVPIGDDCEAQFEFVANRFVKTFFGFTGVGAEKEVLDGKLQIGRSFYSPRDPRGRKRDRYKIEYINREGSRFITHDYTEGTSEDIVIALSPDGSQVEMAVDFEGFLWDRSGNPLMQPGSVIDLAVGAEAASDLYGTDRWGADSSPVIYGYRIE